MAQINEVRYQAEMPTDAPEGYEWYQVIDVVDRSGGYREATAAWKLRPTKDALETARWEAAQKSIAWLERQGFDPLENRPARPTGGYGWESSEITSFALGSQRTGGYVRINSILTAGEQYYQWIFKHKVDGELTTDERWFKQHVAGGFVKTEDGFKFEPKN